MNSIQEILDELVAKDLEVIINGEKDNLIVFDWKQINLEHDATMKEAEGLKGDALNEFYNRNETEISQIEEYYLDEESSEQVESNKWYPFGILGLCHNPESFAEMNHKGLLLFDLTRGDQSNPPVILHAHGETRTLAEKFSDLDINQFIDND